jgi:hypothetical protein
MVLEIKQARIVVSAGGGGEYDVTPNNSAKFDIGDRLDAKPSWRCVAAWWHVSDAIEALSAFHHIDVAPRAGGGDPSDVDLTVKAWRPGQIQIAVSAAYEHA